MSYLLAKNPPNSESELIQRCQRMAGLTFSQIASGLGLVLPENPLQRKGWLGQALERALGADAQSLSLPDFTGLSVELKTLPLNAQGKASESTFVCSIPLLSLHDQHWESSQCLRKLKRVLWVPVEGEKAIPYPQRRVGVGFLWSPNAEEEALLRADWDYLTEMIVTGRLDEIDATHGKYLQIRPKAAHGKSLSQSYDKEGQMAKTLPRGFYLRSIFTTSLVNNQL